MTTAEIAHALVENCRTGDFAKCDDLYSPDIISHEDPAFGGKTKHGLAEKHESDKAWHDSIAEMHSSFTDDAIVGEHTFACAMGFDATMHDGKRMNVRELAIYRVADGKIVEEWFMM